MKSVPSASPAPGPSAAANSSGQFLFTLKTMVETGGRTGAHLLAQQIREQIVASRLPSGTRLFNEGELQDKSGYSRSVVREALRLLESSGLIEVRPGVRGGVFVRATDYHIVRRSLDVLIYLKDISSAAVMEARLEMETLCARLAATHATEADCRDLEASVVRLRQAIDNPRSFADENLHFHMGIGDATRNAILAALMHSLRDIVYDTTFGYIYSRDLLETAVLTHQRIVEAIKARDPDRAGRIMARHIRGFEEYMRETGQLPDGQR